MYQHPYLHEAMKIEQRKDWQRAAARKRILAQLRRQRRGEQRGVIAGLGAVLIKLGGWMERSAQRHKVGSPKVIRNG
jgi:hypothetical protein